MSEAEFFNVISDPEKDAIIDFIQKNTIECVIKIYDSYWRTEFVSTDQKFICVEKKNNFKISDEKIIINFEANSDYYFFKSTVTSDDSKLVIALPEKIFKLQRRNDFRLTMPNNIQPIIKLKNYPELKAEVKDLSMGGCKITFKTDVDLILDLDSNTAIHIKILEFEEKNLPVTIKFIERRPDSKTVTIGLQFIDSNTERITLMRSTLLQLDRILRNKAQD